MSDDDDRGQAAADAAPPRKQRLLLHVGLFLATFLTTTATGALHEHGSWTPSLANIAPISDGLSYSLPLMLILLCHELGHYFAARRHGVDASLPFFIPLPPGFGLGTLGAVIGMRDVATDRKKLIDVGAAGPLAGIDRRDPDHRHRAEAFEGGGRWSASGSRRGTRCSTPLLKRLVTGAWLPDGQRDVIIHPMAFAGWAGLLVTMINLLPIGQLDGGHIASAYFGNRYNRFAQRLHRLLPLGALAVVIWAYFTLQREAGSAWNPNAGGRLRGRGRQSVGDLVRDGVADAAAVARRLSPAGRRQAAAAQPSRAVLGDGGRVRRGVHAGPQPRHAGGARGGATGRGAEAKAAARTTESAAEGAAESQAAAPRRYAPAQPSSP